MDEDSKRTKKSSTGMMKIVFNSKMTVSEQFFTYGFLTYVAENGGFVGLFLGYSVLQLREFIKILFHTPYFLKHQ